MGELANDNKARHHQQFSCVDVAAVGRKWLFLSGEICIVVVRQHNKHQRKTMYSGAEVSRCHSTDRGIQPRQEGLNIKRMAITRQLGLHTATAVNSQTGACSGRRR